MALPDIKIGEPDVLSLEHLRFDPRNPRYLSDRDVDGASDVDIIRFLSERADLGELIQSIGSSGYQDIDPLIVLQEEDHYTVLEGNRRLAAIRLLKDPTLATNCGIPLPEHINPAVPPLAEIRVYRVASREDARKFIGFKHINGPHRWDSLAKARFAADWLKQEKESGSDLTLRDIATALGDGHSTVKRMVAGIYVLDQAQELGIFDIADRRQKRAFAFSTLYTGLTRPGILDYLGLPKDWRKDEPAPNPVPIENKDNLRRILCWLHGYEPDQVDPVVRSQNPHLKQLSEVLEHPKARSIFLNTNDLAEAYTYVYTTAAQFEESLVQAHHYTGKALGDVTGFDGRDKTLLEIAQELAKKARTIVQAMDTEVVETENPATDE